MKKITIKPQALANGIVLPAGTVFEVVEIAAHLANPAFENPAEWDGRRYFDLRQKASSAGASTSKYDWGAATRDDLNFGYATHMCPGRSAGCSIVKMFIVKFLSRYELCLDDGETERYEDVHFGQFVRKSSVATSFSSSSPFPNCSIVSIAPRTDKQLLDLSKPDQAYLATPQKVSMDDDGSCGYCSRANIRSAVQRGISSEIQIVVGSLVDFGVSFD